MEQSSLVYMDNPLVDSSVCVHLRFNCLGQVLLSFFSSYFFWLGVRMPVIARVNIPIATSLFVSFSLIIPPGLVHPSKRRQEASCNFLHLKSLLHQPSRVRHIRLLLNLCHHHLALCLHPDCLLLPPRSARLPCSRLPHTVFLFISPSFGRGRTGQGPLLAWLELLFHLAV